MFAARKYTSTKMHGLLHLRVHTDYTLTVSWNVLLVPLQTLQLSLRLWLEYCFCAPYLSKLTQQTHTYTNKIYFVICVRLLECSYCGAEELRAGATEQGEETGSRVREGQVSVVIWDSQTDVRPRARPSVSKLLLLLAQKNFSGIAGV